MFARWCLRLRFTCRVRAHQVLLQLPKQRKQKQNHSHQAFRSKHWHVISFVCVFFFLLEFADRNDGSSKFAKTGGDPVNNCKQKETETTLEWYGAAFNNPFCVPTFVFLDDGVQKLSGFDDVPLGLRRQLTTPPKKTPHQKKVSQRSSASVKSVWMMADRDLVEASAQVDQVGRRQAVAVQANTLQSQAKHVVLGRTKKKKEKYK